MASSALLLSLLLLACSFVALGVVSSQQGDINYQSVTIELFMDNALDDAMPCESPDNFTLTFKDMQLTTGQCTTHLFPQYSSAEEEGGGTKWLQFSAKAFAREDGGLQIWLYFTRNDNTGAITYCSEQNIGGMPYPLEISADLNGQCYIVDLPHLDPYASATDEDDQRSMAVRVSYNQNAVKSIIAGRTAQDKDDLADAQDEAKRSSNATVTKAD